MKKILVTGSAGFIGFHLTKALLELGYQVVGIDNLNDYYDPKLKLNRLKVLEEYVTSVNLSANYQFFKLDISHYDELKILFKENAFDIVINLAAQAGVRYSLKKPLAYVEANVRCFVTLLEAVHAVNNTVPITYASSSSVCTPRRAHVSRGTDTCSYAGCSACVLSRR